MTTQNAPNQRPHPLTETKADATASGLGGRKLYLASGSPRRGQLLSQINCAYETVIAPTEEVALPGESPASFVQRMAVEKASNGFAKVPGLAIWVVGADTAICLDKQVLGQPRTVAAAKRMLRQLSGRTHQVLSSVCVVHDGEVSVRLNQTQVTFRPLTETEIEAYCQTSEPLDKAGAYAIQGQAARFIERIEGSYSAVMGLALFELDQLLQATGFWERQDV